MEYTHYITEGRPRFLKIMVHSTFYTFSSGLKFVTIAIKIEN